MLDILTAGEMNHPSGAVPAGPMAPVLDIATGIATIGPGEYAASQLIRWVTGSLASHS